MTRLLAISPHLDDAVFACGELIAAHPGASVVTVFAGVPPAQPCTGWDVDCGYRGSPEAMRERRREDRAALALLGAEPRWLDFLDAQYAPCAGIERLKLDVRKALNDEVHRLSPDTVALPLGLFHSDHTLVSRAAVPLVDGARTWLAYEDALYRRLPGALHERITEISASGIDCEPMEPVISRTEAKREAVLCYASQLRGLATAGRPGHADLDALERYWKLRR